MTGREPQPSDAANKIAEAYSSEPWWYDVRGFLILTFAYRSTLPAQLRLFGRNFGAQHLELACGTGTLLDLVLKWRRAKRLPEVDITGVDYADRMLAGARHRFAGRSNMHFMLGDAANLRFADAAFDTVNVANAVHCFPEVDASLAEGARVLKPGGTLAANVLLFPRGPQPFRAIAERINAWGMRKGILHTPYALEDIRSRILKTGLEMQWERVSGNCYEVIARKPVAAAA